MADIFLSASVPDPKSPNFCGEADTIAVMSAVTSLVYLTLGRRKLIWGGHPAITPMVASVANSLHVDYGEWTKLYQSRFFRGSYPDENVRFPEIEFIDAIAGDREASLRAMRAAMFTDNDFDCAIFIGGMKGVADEFELLQTFQPEAKCFPILSTGGATALLADIAQIEESLKQRLSEDMDYVRLFRDITDISLTEDRHQNINGGMQA